MTDVPLPKLRRVGPAYLVVLAVLAIGFYMLLLAFLGLVAYGLYALVLATPDLAMRGGLFGIKLLVALYIGILAFGAALVRGLCARAGSGESGIELDRRVHSRVFALTDSVAARVDARPIDDVHVTPGPEVGVREEAALYIPPGMGRRRLVLGMAFLEQATLDDLRSVLAHEYAHFTNRDSGFSRYIGRVFVSCDAVIDAMSHQRYAILNPCLWIMYLYMLVYGAVNASFSRHREYLADRASVEAYGREAYARSLAGAALAGVFFMERGLQQVVQTAHVYKGVGNLHHTLGVERRVFSLRNGGEVRRVLGHIMMEEAGIFDSHPSLRDRFRAQNVPTANLKPPPLPRLVTNQALLQAIDPDLVPALLDGPPSAAEELFGEQAIAMQVRLSETLQARYLAYKAAVRQARAAGLDG